jgi:gas vesicle protein
MKDGDGMKDVLNGVAIGAIIAAVGWLLLYPYYSLANLKNIAEELEKIRKVIEDKKVTK